MSNPKIYTAVFYDESVTEFSDALIDFMASEQLNVQSSDKHYRRNA